MNDQFDHTPEEAAAYTAGQLHPLHRMQMIHRMTEALISAHNMRHALERISDAYPGDHDYPGIIARRALDAAHHTAGDACPLCGTTDPNAGHVAAFGAIRRAAELARNYDACADRESPYYLDQLSAAVNVERASVIREAVRAAIGSKKA